LLLNEAIGQGKDAVCGLLFLAEIVLCDYYLWETSQATCVSHILDESKENSTQYQTSL
jgi:hypothetical protein